MYRGDALTSFSYPDYQDIRNASKLLQGIAGRDDLRVGVVIDREAEPAWAEIVTANYFDVLGVPIAAGRGFLPSDDVHRHRTDGGVEPRILGRSGSARIRK